MMKKITKELKRHVVVGVICCLCSTSVFPFGNVIREAKAADYGISSPRITKEGTTWDKVTFGHYYQSADLSTDQIKWRILSIEGDVALLIADENLDWKPYNETVRENGVVWENCTLRSWLNGYSASVNADGKDYTKDNFLNTAFTSEEQELIKEINVTAEGDEEYNLVKGNDTKDKIYLLSKSEVLHGKYGFAEGYKKSRAKNTDYVKIQGADSNESGYGNWWLRNSGGSTDYYAIVDTGGAAYGEMSSQVHRYGVRPVLQVSLSSDLVSDAGTIDSEGNYIAGNGVYENPMIDEDTGDLTWDCVYFGHYKQNAYFEKKPIEWRVLSVDGNDAFLLAEQNLAAKVCNETGITDETVWANCTLRSWLNGYDGSQNSADWDYTSDNFINEAFTKEEQEAIKATNVTVEREYGEAFSKLVSQYDKQLADSLFGIGKGSDTTDRVFLLSLSEAYDSNYGFAADAFAEASKTRQAKDSDYMRMNKRSAYRQAEDSWWVRTSGMRGFFWINEMGFYDMGSGGELSVRPAMHISLDAGVWSKIGTVSVEGDGQADGKEPPTSADDSLKEDDKDVNTEVTVKCTGIKAAKKSYTIQKKGKSIKAVFYLTTAPKNSLTKEKVTVKVKNEKIAKVIKKRMTKKELTVTMKGIKKGKTVLHVKVGTKSAKVTVQVKK